MSLVGSCALATHWLRLHSRNVPAPVPTIHRPFTRVGSNRQAAHAPKRKYEAIILIQPTLSRYSIQLGA